MTEEEWNEISKRMIIDGYKVAVVHMNNVKSYIAKLKSEIQKLKETEITPMKDLLAENEKLYKIIIDLRGRIKK